jgi:hypothetical protein
VVTLRPAPGRLCTRHVAIGGLDLTEFITRLNPDLLAGRLSRDIRRLFRGCSTCSSIADSVNGILPHLNARGVTMLLVSQAPLETFAGVQAADGLQLPLGVVGQQ